MEVEQVGAFASPPGSPKEAILPSSPYDESVEFDVEDDEEETDSVHLKKKVPTKGCHVESHTTPAVVPEEGDMGYPDPAMSRPSPRPRPTPVPRKAVVVSKAAHAPPRPCQWTPQSAELQALVQDVLRDSVRRTDVYHTLQVHLGFIGDNYTMTSIRGQAVKSVPPPVVEHRRFTQGHGRRTHPSQRGADICHDQDYQGICAGRAGP